MKVLHIDKNHPILEESLLEMGFENHLAHTATRAEVLSVIHKYTGLVVRSRITIDKELLDAAKNLKFIARVGAGLESIDTDYASEKGILLFSAPEGNRDAVGEHATGMLLSLLHNLQAANTEVKQGKWNREANRGRELKHLCVGIIGYGNMGKAFSKCLRGFGCEVLCYDIKDGVGDENARQVSLEEFQEKVDVLSLHTPWTPLTNKMINKDFINAFEKPFWLINTARGKSLVTEDLVEALKEGKILSAGLDVLEYEKTSFESLFSEDMPQALKDLLAFPQVILSPHIAGWTVESKMKLAQTLIDKISDNLKHIIKND